MILTWLFPVFRIGGFLATVGICAGVAYLLGKASGKAEESARDKAEAGGTQHTRPNTTSARKAAQNGQASSGQAASVKKPQKKSYGPEIDPIVEEGNRALSEMGRLYMTIKDTDVRVKINEIMRITDKITQDAIEDPSDIPQIKKFFRYYLPTTIKLLNAYDRMSSQGIEGENIGKSMNSINEMLDVAIEAYKKRLDSLFENQALDIETDIDVLNQMLEREGLSGGKDFNVGSKPQTQTGSAGAVQTSGGTQAQYF